MKSFFQVGKLYTEHSISRNAIVGLISSVDFVKNNNKITMIYDYSSVKRFKGGFKSIIIILEVVTEFDIIACTTALGITETYETNGQNIALKILFNNMVGWIFANKYWLSECLERIY